MALRHFQWQMRPNQPQCFSSSARLRCIVGNRIVRHYPGGTSVPVALHQSWSTRLPTMPRGALGRQMQCWRTAGHFVPGPRLNVGKIHRIGREALSHRKTGLNLPSRASPVAKKRMLGGVAGSGPCTSVPHAAKRSPHARVGYRTCRRCGDSKSASRSSSLRTAAEICSIRS